MLLGFLAMMEESLGLDTARLGLFLLDRFGVEVERAACLLPKTEVKLIGVKNSASD